MKNENPRDGRRKVKEEEEKKQMEEDKAETEGKYSKHSLFNLELQYVSLRQSGEIWELFRIYSQIL